MNEMEGHTNLKSSLKIKKRRENTRYANAGVRKQFVKNNIRVHEEVFFS